MIEVDGRKLEVDAGVNVAAALIAHGVRTLRLSPAGKPRGAFCMMGVCQECLVTIDDRLQQACLVPVTADMQIATGATS